MEKKTETLYQCYYIDENGKRCEKEQYDYWCSEEHRINWQEKVYGQINGNQKIEKAQRRLLEHAKFKRFRKDGQGRLI